MNAAEAGLRDIRRATEVGDGGEMERKEEQATIHKQVQQAGGATTGV